MELNINGMVVSLNDTGNVSKAGKRILKTEAVLQDGTKLYINAYAPGDTSKANKESVAPRIRRGSEKGQTAPVTAEVKQPDMAALVAEAVAKAMQSMMPKVAVVEAAAPAKK